MNKKKYYKFLSKIYIFCIIVNNSYTYIFFNIKIIYYIKKIIQNINIKGYIYTWLRKITKKLILSIKIKSYYNIQNYIKYIKYKIYKLIYIITIYFYK